MATVADLIAGLTTLDPAQQVNLNALATASSTPPAAGPTDWIPKAYAKDTEIERIQQSFYVEYAGQLDHCNPNNLSRVTGGLVKRLKFKIALYIVCKYGEVGYRQLPWDVRQLLTEQDQGQIGFMPT
jgi:hypothetical protein